MEKYQDRLLFGSDLSPRPQMYRACFRILESEDEHFYEEVFRNVQSAQHGLGLSEQSLQKIYRGNALKILAAP